MIKTVNPLLLWHMEAIFIKHFPIFRKPPAAPRTDWKDNKYCFCKMSLFLISQEQITKFQESIEASVAKDITHFVLFFISRCFLVLSASSSLLLSCSFLWFLSTCSSQKQKGSQPLKSQKNSKPASLRGNVIRLWRCMLLKKRHFAPSSDRPP